MHKCRTDTETVYDNNNSCLQEETTWAETGLFLLAIAFAASAAGSYLPPLEFIMCAVFTIWFLIKRQESLKVIITAIFVMFILNIIVPREISRWAGLWHLSITLSVVEFINWYSPRTSPPSRSGNYTSYILVCVLVIIFDMLFLGNPIMRPGLDNSLRSLSIFLTKILGGVALPLGTTYYSLPVLVAFLFFILLQRSWRLRIFLLLGFVASIVIYFAAVEQLQIYAISFEAPRSLTGWYDRSDNMFQMASEPINARFILLWLATLHPQLILLGLLIFVHFAAYRICDREQAGFYGFDFQKLSKVWLFSFAGIGVVAGILLCWITIPKTTLQTDLYNHKVAMLTSNLEMRIPTHGLYGFREVGMFGRTPRILRSYGMKVDEINSIENLRPDHEILILANPQDNFTYMEKTKILQWVKDGGGLLMITDHTGDKALRLPVNDLFQSLGMEVGFDCAKVISANGGFDYEMWLGTPLQPVRGVRWRGSQQYGTGGSVRVFGSATPILQARYAFIEPGTFTAANQGNIGNLKYDIDEPLGDVLLAGISYSGKGRAILMGDTSPFQNGASPNGYAFVQQILGLLLPGGPNPRMQSIEAFILGISVCSMIFLAISFQDKRSIVVFIIAATAVWAGGWRIMFTRPQPININGNMAIIDITHLPYISLQDWTLTDLTGLATGLMREGYEPVFTETNLAEQLSVADKEDVLFLVAPLAAFNSKDCKAIDEFLQRGGVVILNCGYEEAANVNQLLKAYGMKISDTPLGATEEEQAAKPDHIHFANAWQVNGADDTLFTLKGYVVAVSKVVGKGHFVVIGDSKFFWDTNIESREFHRPGNIRFLTRLMMIPQYSGRISKSWESPQIETGEISTQKIQK